jgi:aspartate dehydrogenase
MLKVGLIGYGAIAQFAHNAMKDIDATLVLVIVRQNKIESTQSVLGPDVDVAQTLGNARPDIMVDCAGHSALKEHGVEILSAGVPLVTVSIGALANSSLHNQLYAAAQAGSTSLRLASGALGALDALSSARMGNLQSVTYTGSKPPNAWKGSRAEQVLNLDDLTNIPAIHFEGSARDAALLYPKNANVAAAIALAGIGFEKTSVKLIADPTINKNSHEIRAEGDFGNMLFSIEGNTLPENPHTSALAAMSVVKILSEEASQLNKQS